VFAEKLELEPPQTGISFTAPNQDSVYLGFPIVEFPAFDNPTGTNCGIDKTYYSLDRMNTWQQYTEPFLLEKFGFILIYFKSVDLCGNVEEPKNHGVNVNLDESIYWIYRLKLPESQITVSDNPADWH
jgi:hypothetical protein